MVVGRVAGAKLSQRIKMSMGTNLRLSLAIENYNRIRDVNLIVHASS